MRIDHVVFATADLDVGAARFEDELGLAVLAGGRHDGLGTHNRIAPLARGFVELLAVADAAEAHRSETGAALIAALAQGDGWLSWAVAVPDVGAVAAALGISTASVGRLGWVEVAGDRERLSRWLNARQDRRRRSGPARGRHRRPRAAVWEPGSGGQASAALSASRSAAPNTTRLRVAT